MTSTDYGRHPSPPPLPAAAIGFIACRPDRNTHIALYHPDGALSLTFGASEDPHRICARAGLTMTEIATAPGFWAVSKEG